MKKEEKELLTAANSGDPKAQYQLATKYFKEKKKKNAVNWYEKSAKGGYFLAMVALVGRYIYDNDVVRNWSRGYAWFRKARRIDEQRLFIVYRNIADGEKLCDEGEYDAAIKKGFMGGYFGLAEASDDPELKYAYYKQGCDWGDINCMLGLSECLRRGIGCEIDETGADEIYQEYLKEKKEIDLM